MREFFRHQLRWSRTIRDARPWGFVGLLFTFGLPWALATVLAARGMAWAWAWLAITFAVRLMAGFVVAALVLDDRKLDGRKDDPRFVRNIVLLPLRDLIAPLVWAASFLGNRIHWRGDRFHLKDGRLSRE
jgi:ceramide glucosyltransferase